MKNIVLSFLLLSIVLFSSNNSLAKTNAYEYGDILIGTGLSFGYFGYYGSYSSASVPLVLSAEYGLRKYFSLGGFLGVQNYKYTGFYYDGIFAQVPYTYSCSAVSIGLKGSFHVFPFINDRYDARVDDSSMDAYITGFLGSSFHTYREVTSTGYAGYNQNMNRLVLGPSLGFRYMFSPQVGAFVELGVGAFGISTAGVAFDL